MKITLDIRKIQYMNIFSKVTRMKARNCFNYGPMIVFTVPGPLVSRAIGRDNQNLSILSQRIGKRVRILAEPQGQGDLDHFIKIIIYPNQYKKISLENDQLVIFGDQKARATLIGKEKKRLEELSNILNKFFHIKKVLIR
ncbi:MAG: hypothetical protein ABH817_01015 [archaeon]